MNYKRILFPLSCALSLQFAVSVFVHSSYSRGHEHTGWIVPFAASVLFCVGSFLVSVQLNQVIGRPFCGTLIFLIVALPFFALMLLGQYSNAEHGRIIATILNLGFLHLGGFRAPIIGIFGPQLLLNPFYAVIMTTVIQAIGPFLADLTQLVKRIKHHA